MSPAKQQPNSSIHSPILRLQRILLPKTPFFVCQKMQILSKMLPQKN